MKKVLSIFLCMVLCLSFAACGGKKTVESYLNSIQSQITEMENALKDTGMNLKVTAKENSLIYTYQFEMDLGDSAELVASGLEESMKSMSSVFKGIVEALKKEIPSAESVVVQYLDKDGKVLYSQEFN